MPRTEELLREFFASTSVLQGTKDTVRAFMALSADQDALPELEKQEVLDFVNEVLDKYLVPLMAETVASYYREEEVEELIQAHKQFPILHKWANLKEVMPTFNKKLQAVFADELKKKLEGETE